MLQRIRRRRRNYLLRMKLMKILKIRITKRALVLDLMLERKIMVQPVRRKKTQLLLKILKKLTKIMLMIKLPKQNLITKLDTEIALKEQHLLSKMNSMILLDLWKTLSPVQKLMARLIISLLKHLDIQINSASYR